MDGLEEKYGENALNNRHLWASKVNLYRATRACDFVFSHCALSRVSLHSTVQTTRSARFPPYLYITKCTFH